MDKPNYYAVITSDVRYDKDLSDSEKLLYAEITALTNMKGYCWSTNEYFANLYNVSERTISRRINKLKEKGYIDIEITNYDNSIKTKRVIKLTARQNCLPRLDKTVHHHVDKSVYHNSTLSTNITKDSRVDTSTHKKVVDYLNETCGTKYRHTTKATQRHINARLNEGFTLEQFKQVIDIKSSQWLDDPKMSIYLRPETLFGTKFESYLNEPKPHKEKEIKKYGEFI